MIEDESRSMNYMSYNYGQKSVTNTFNKTNDGIMIEKYGDRTINEVKGV